MYTPYYTWGDMFDAIVEKVKDGVGRIRSKISVGTMSKASRIDAYEDYDCPFVISD